MGILVIHTNFVILISMSSKVQSHIWLYLTVVLKFRMIKTTLQILNNNFIYAYVFSLRPKKTYLLSHLESFLLYMTGYIQIWTKVSDLGVPSKSFNTPSRTSSFNTQMKRTSACFRMKPESWKKVFFQFVPYFGFV